MTWLGHATAVVELGDRRVLIDPLGRRRTRAAGKVDAATVDGMRGEFARVQSNPDAVFFYSFVQARATVY